MSGVWKTEKLGALLKVQNGFAFDSDKFSKAQGTPLIRIRDLKNGSETAVCFSGEFDEQYVVRAGDLLIGMDGEFRCYKWAGEISLLNQRVCRLVNFSDEVEPDFVRFGINRHLKRIEDTTPFVTVKHLSSKSILGIDFSYPDRNEQRRIVIRVQECLDRVDEAEELRKQANLEAKSIEYACFHDALMHGIKTKGWPVATLGDVAESFRYGTSAKANTDPTGVPILRMGNIQEGYLDFSDLKYMQISDANLDRYRLAEGDILINRTNSLELVGKAATFNRPGGNWVYASYLIRVRVDLVRVLPEFVTAVINSRMGREYVMRTARRAIGMVNLNANEMAKFPLPLPSIVEQTQIVDLLNAARPLAEELRTNMAEPQLEFLRDSILSKAFDGGL